MKDKPVAKTVRFGACGEEFVFPASVDKNLSSECVFDMRQPESNPLLSEVSPLHEMRDDVVKVLEKGDVISFVVLLGSSGVGKTTAAFLVAKQRWSIFVEASNNTTHSYKTI
jgi:flagellar biosynthesis GTPase FlhF